MKIISYDLIQSVSDKARRSDRKRMNHNFHEYNGDPMHRFLNAMEPETYIQPHKHENPDKRELFIILRGRAAVLTFDLNGKVTMHSVLNAEKGPFGVEIPERVYHSVIVLEQGSVFLEIKDGPWNPQNDKDFAAWAPAETDSLAEKEKYKKKLITLLNIK